MAQKIVTRLFYPLTTLTKFIVNRVPLFAPMDKAHKNFTSGAAISRNVQCVLFENFAQAVLSETGQEGYQSENVEALYKKEEKMTMMMISRMLMTAMLLLFPLNIVKHQQLPIA